MDVKIGALINGRFEGRVERPKSVGGGRVEPYDAFRHPGDIKIAHLAIEIILAGLEGPVIDRNTPVLHALCVFCLPTNRWERYDNLDATRLLR